MSAGSSSTHRRSGSKPKGAVRAKSGCYTCRIRRKKCDEKPDEHGSCQTCVRLRLQCLGFGAKRPDWMREGNSVVEIRGKIKSFLAQNGMIKGHSGPTSLRSDAASPSAEPDMTSPSGTSLPLSQTMADQGTGGLSTPLSATSTLTPEDGSSPSHSPSSHTAPVPFADDNSLPPTYLQAVGTHYERRDSSTSGLHHGEHSGSGVLLLSNGRPIPPRSQSHVGPVRTSRRSPFGTGSTSGALGLFSVDHPMDSLDTSGHTLTNGNNNTRRSPPALFRRRRTADLLGYGRHSSGNPPFPRSFPMTATSPSIGTMTACARASPMPYPSISSRFSTGSLASPSLPAASNPTPCYHTHSTMQSTANFIPNATIMYSPTFGSSSSTSSSSPMTTHGTPFSPCTPLPTLSAFPQPNNNKPSVNMDWVPDTPSSSYTAITGSNTGLLSPYPNSASPGSGMDGVDINWASGQMATRSGLVYESNPNYNTGTNASNVRVKIEPDVASLDIDRGLANDWNVNTAEPLRPRSVPNDGDTTPLANTFNASELGSTHHVFTINSLYHGNSSHVMDDYPYNYEQNPTSTNPHAFHTISASTSMGTRGHAVYTPGAMTVDPSYHNAPQLSPDSPKPSRQADPMMGTYAHGPISNLAGQGESNGYAAGAHHGAEHFNMHPGHVRQSGIGGGNHGGYGYGHNDGYGHSQAAPGSSWAGDDQRQHQNQLLIQQIPNQTAYDWSHSTRRTDLLSPSLQSSFGPLYHFQDGNSIDGLTMNGFEPFGPQQAPAGGMTISGAENGALIFASQAPINEMDFSGLPHEDQQHMYQELAPTQSMLQPALADPLYADRMDRSLVEHYLRYVRPVQFFFLDECVAHLLRVPAFSNDAVRNAICSVASVHKRRMREGSAPLRVGTSPGLSRRTPLALIEGLPDAPEGDDGNDYYNRTKMALNRAGQGRLTEAEAMAGLQCVSSFLFAGGVGGWDFFLGVACQWLGTVFAELRLNVDSAYLLDAVTHMKRRNELGSFIVRTTMWFEVLASVTMVREPKFLSEYRALFADSARFVEVDGVPIQAEAGFSMREVMGCDNLTFLALAEISALAAWKEGQMKKQTLSFVELSERKCKIEDRCFRDLAEADMNGYRDASLQGDDSLENRRRLTADIFRASARLYLHTVLSGDKPGVKEIRQGVVETIDALRRVPSQPKSLQRSVVRSVVFPICLAGCMTDVESEQATLKELLQSEGGAGNCGSVVAVMETVWERRDKQKKGARGGRRRAAEYEADVSWRDVLREHGGGVPILLV